MNREQTTPLPTDRIVTIAVDMQKDFMSGGSLAVPGGEQVLAPLNRVMRFAREQGGVVAATRDWHPESTPHFDVWPVHCVGSTKGAEFHPDLELEADDVIISKGMGQTHGYSGFEGFTDNGLTLEQIVRPRRRGERVTVLIGGVATEYCVLNTARDNLKVARTAEESGEGTINTVLVSDAVAAVDLQPGDGERAITGLLEARTITLTSRDILAGAVQVGR